MVRLGDGGRKEGSPPAKMPTALSSAERISFKVPPYLDLLLVHLQAQVTFGS